MCKIIRIQDDFPKLIKSNWIHSYMNGKNEWFSSIWYPNASICMQVSLQSWHWKSAQIGIRDWYRGIFQLSEQLIMFFKYLALPRTDKEVVALRPHLITKPSGGVMGKKINKTGMPTLKPQWHLFSTEVDLGIWYDKYYIILYCVF